MGADEKPVSEVLVPAEQDTVDFYGHPLIVVRLEDGRICAVLRWLCRGLNLDPSGQLERIKRRAALTEGLVRVQVNTAGGPQEMPAITLRVLPGWLYTIDETRVKPEAREDIIVFQRECTDVLAEHFANKPRQALPAPDTLVPSEPITKPEHPAADADRSAWIEYHEAMVAWMRWQDEIDRWRASVDQRQTELEGRMEGIEEVTRLIPEILDRLGPETLSPEHQATVKNLAKRLNELAGFSYAMIYGELNAAFHVGKYSDIPAARWPDVLAWFKARVDAAERSHAR